MSTQRTASLVVTVRCRLPMTAKSRTMIATSTPAVMAQTNGDTAEITVDLRTA